MKDISCNNTNSHSGVLSYLKQAVDYVGKPLAVLATLVGPLAPAVAQDRTAPKPVSGMSTQGKFDYASRILFDRDRKNDNRGLKVLADIRNSHSHSGKTYRAAEDLLGEYFQDPANMKLRCFNVGITVTDREHGHDGELEPGDYFGHGNTHPQPDSSVSLEKAAKILADAGAPFNKIQLQMLAANAAISGFQAAENRYGRRAGEWGAQTFLWGKQVHALIKAGYIGDKGILHTYGDSGDVPLAQIMDGDFDNVEIRPGDANGPEAYSSDSLPEVLPAKNGPGWNQTAFSAQVIDLVGTSCRSTDKSPLISHNTKKLDAQIAAEINRMRREGLI